MSSINLPVELWRCIAQRLPRNELLNMLELNSIFFHLAMDEKYGEVSIFQLKRSTPDFLAHLRSPFITSRIRLLRMRPYFIQEVTNLLLAGLGSTFPNLNQVIPLLEDLLDHLHNLRECHVVWYDLPLLEHTTTQRLLQKTMSSSLQLRKISIAASLEKFGTLLSGDIVPRQLEELELSIRSELFDSPSQEITRHLLERQLASFMNNARQTLTTLSFESSTPMDFSPLFSSLTHFPSLRSLSLTIPSCPPYLGNIQSFIHTHAEGLTHLSLRGLHIDPLSSYSHGQSASSFRDWFQFNFMIPMNNLQRLTIATNFFPVDLALLCVQLFGQTLTCLDVSGRHLSYQQAEILFSHAQQGQLKELRLGTVTLSPELVDMLAEQLPYLKKLDLRIREVVPHKDDECQSIYKKSRSQEQAQIAGFFREMQKRVYRDWHLEDMKVWRFASKMQLQREYINLFEDCVPSLPRFR